MPCAASWTTPAERLGGLPRPISVPRNRLPCYLRPSNLCVSRDSPQPQSPQGVALCHSASRSNAAPQPYSRSCLLLSWSAVARLPPLAVVAVVEPKFRPFLPDCKLPLVTRKSALPGMQAQCHELQRKALYHQRRPVHKSRFAHGNQLHRHWSHQQHALLLRRHRREFRWRERRVFPSYCHSFRARHGPSRTHKSPSHGGQHANQSHLDRQHRRHKL